MNSLYFIHVRPLQQVHVLYVLCQRSQMHTDHCKSISMKNWWKSQNHLPATNILFQPSIKMFSINCYMRIPFYLKKQWWSLIIKSPTFPLESYRVFLEQSDRWDHTRLGGIVDLRGHTLLEDTEDTVDHSGKPVPHPNWKTPAHKIQRNISHELISPPLSSFHAHFSQSQSFKKIKPALQMKTDYRLLIAVQPSEWGVIPIMYCPIMTVMPDRLSLSKSAQKAWQSLHPIPLLKPWSF